MLHCTLFYRFCIATLYQRRQFCRFTFRVYLRIITELPSPTTTHHRKGNLQPTDNTSLCLQPQPLFGPALLIPCGATPWGLLPHNMTPPPHTSCEADTSWMNAAPRPSVAAGTGTLHQHSHSRSHHHDDTVSAPTISSVPDSLNCQNNTDRDGVNLAEYPGSSTDKCAAACKEQWPTCKAWVFNACFKQMCYLKSTIAPPTAKHCSCAGTSLSVYLSICACACACACACVYVCDCLYLPTHDVTMFHSSCRCVMGCCFPTLTSHACIRTRERTDTHGRRM